MSNLTFNQAHYRLQLSDALYGIAENCGMTDEWVKEHVQTIEYEVLAKSGVDLSEA